ncbi:hypothetical protein ES288_A10G121900v1 [Gossypium darwinii]|uniref:Uncharacterized protein n=1 Tax=Gossypium darwinii TaxID=34276 RepID=A0A5D2EXY1_GOSDA|nr:hypothetical protein ES288_A10G121900v1 [Gossypium darwinii]
MVPLASFETPLKARLRKLKESKEALNPPFWVRCRRWKSVLRRATTRSRSCQRLVVVPRAVVAHVSEEAAAESLQLGFLLLKIFSWLGCLGL